MKALSKTADNMGKAPIVYLRAMNRQALGRMAKLQGKALLSFQMDLFMKAISQMANPTETAKSLIQMGELTAAHGLRERSTARVLRPTPTACAMRVASAPQCITDKAP